jgi:hypothetical protein
LVVITKEPHNLWKGIYVAKAYCQRGMKYIHEVWLGECPLRIKYGKLFNICHQQEWEIFRVLGNGQINLTFRRNFEASELMEWMELESELAEIELTSEENSVKWAITARVQFTVHSLYIHWTFPGVRDIKIEEL